MLWKYVKYIAPGIIGTLLLLVVIWGVVIGPRLVDFKAETAAISNLPGAWGNKRVALIADLQIGMWLGNEGTVKKIVNRIIEERPEEEIVRETIMLITELMKSFGTAGHEFIIGTGDKMKF